ncbi:MAG TPA: hypothetical protein VK168_10140 [Saprospiraceae bacterium]|nr:hypothetical protein [Saprospiraceae bacterium]
MSTARIYLEQLLAKGKLEAALEAGMILCRHYQDTEANAIVVQQSGQFHNLMDDYHAGTISLDDFRPERARINLALLDWVHSIPETWTTEALDKAGFSEKSFEKDASAAPRKSWFLPIIIVLILGTAVGAVWFLRSGDQPATEAVNKTPETKAAPQVQSPPDSILRQSAKTTQPTQKPVAQSKSLPKPQKNTSPVISSPTTEPKPQPAQNLATPDQKFRSFAKSAIYDDMELGYMGDKYAFRNVRTKEILCCYAAAKGFSDGKAFVSTDGKSFFFINKKGEKIQK